MIYIGLSVWTLVYVALERPQEVAVSAGLIATGAVIYFLTRTRQDVEA